MTMLAWLKTTFLQFEHRGPQANRHGITTRIFHWLTGALLIYGLVFNAEVEVLSDPAALAREIAFALALGGLFLIRLIWIESFGGGSRLPPDAPRWERVLSRAVHYGIYALVLAIVLSGLAIALTASSPPSLFGVGFPFAVDPAWRGFLLDLHEALAGALVLLIAAHLLGAIWHWLVRNDGVWQSMLWGLSRPIEPRGTSVPTVSGPMRVGDPS